MLAGTKGNPAVEFYEGAFGAKLLWKLVDKEVVVGLSIGSAKSDGGRTMARVQYLHEPESCT